MRRLASILLAGLLSGLESTGFAADWPQFLGPSRNGSTGDSVSDKWTAAEPATLWKLKAGHGFAGPAVAAGKALLFHRRGDQEVLTCVDAVTGKPAWERQDATAYVDDFGFDDGPRAVPAVADGRVFTFGADGRLVARNLADGGKLWEIETASRYHTPKGFFGRACSPLVEGGLVLLNLGGTGGAGIAAFEVTTGKLAWQATDHEAGYASPVAAEIAGVRLGLFFTREGLVGVEMAQGRQRFVHPWRARMSASVNAASPLVFGDEVLLTSSYDVGAILLRLGDGKATEVWSGDESLSAHYATPVRKGELVFGFHGRQEQGPALRCVEWKTGKVRWSEDGFGAGTLALAGDQLVILRETGELVLAPAVAGGFKPTRRAQIIGSNRAAFALADGVLFARDKSNWVAVELRPH